MRVSLGSLGVYPDEPCYDPNRPSWYPYWINDAAEDECVTGASNVVSSIWDTFTNPSLLAEETGNTVGGAAGSAVSAAASAAGSIASGAAAGLENSLTLGGGILALAAVGIGVFLLIEAVK